MAVGVCARPAKLPYFSAPSNATLPQVLPILHQSRPVTHPIYLYLLHAFYGTDPSPTTEYQHQLDGIFSKLRATETSSTLFARFTHQASLLQTRLGSNYGGVFNHAHRWEIAHTAIMAEHLTATLCTQDGTISAALDGFSLTHRMAVRI